MKQSIGSTLSSIKQIHSVDSFQEVYADGRDRILIKLEQFA